MYASVVLLGRCGEIALESRDVGLEDEVAQVQVRLPRDEAEQGALPRAVGADQGDLVPHVDEGVGVLEDERLRTSY